MNASLNVMGDSSIIFLHLCVTYWRINSLIYSVMCKLRNFFPPVVAVGFGGECSNIQFSIRSIALMIKHFKLSPIRIVCIRQKFNSMVDLLHPLKTYSSRMPHMKPRDEKIAYTSILVYTMWTVFNEFFQNEIIIEKRHLS